MASYCFFFRLFAYFGNGKDFGSRHEYEGVTEGNVG